MENTDNPERLKGIFEGFIQIAKEGFSVIVLLHPRTHKALSSISFNEISSNILIIEPVSYLDMLILEKNTRVILTNSGGVQKEAFFFRVPCVTLREETEWVETVEIGWNVLVGCDSDRIFQAAVEALAEMDSVFPYGDGRAAERIVQWLWG